MSLISFYMTPTDIGAVLRAVEEAESLRCYIAGHADGSAVYSTAAEIPNLGVADSESGISCTTFVVAAEATPVHIRRIPAGFSFMDQLINPDTVTLTAAGVWESSTIIEGRVATAYGTPPSQKLMRRFKSVISKRSTKYYSRWVGTEALALARKGYRLTAAIQSPAASNLRIDS